MGDEKMYLKSLIFMLANRVDRLEEKIDALDKEERDASKRFFESELKKLDELI